MILNIVMIYLYFWIIWYNSNNTVTRLSLLLWWFWCYFHHHYEPRQVKRRLKSTLRASQLVELLQQYRRQRNMFGSSFSVESMSVFRWFTSKVETKSLTIGDFLHGQHWGDLDGGWSWDVSLGTGAPTSPKACLCCEAQGQSAGCSMWEIHRQPFAHSLKDGTDWAELIGNFRALCGSASVLPAPWQSCDCWNCWKLPSYPSYPSYPSWGRDSGGRGKKSSHQSFRTSSPRPMSLRRKRLGAGLSVIEETWGFPLSKWLTPPDIYIYGISSVKYIWWVIHGF